MKSITPELALASLFALLAFVAVMASEYAHNPYFLISAGAFALATYVTYPPRWILSLSKVIAGKQDDEGK